MARWIRQAEPGGAAYIRDAVLGVAVLAAFLYVVFVGCIFPFTIYGICVVESVVLTVLATLAANEWC